VVVGVLCASCELGNWAATKQLLDIGEGRFTSPVWFRLAILIASKRRFKVILRQEADKFVFDGMCSSIDLSIEPHSRLAVLSSCRLIQHQGQGVSEYAGQR
jgi:hypothetical protein